MDSAGEPLSLLVFRIGEYQFAVAARHVERVVRAAGITPVPDSPAAVHGVVNIQGEFLPVISGRACFSLPWRDIEPESFFILLRADKGVFALVADVIDGVMNVSPTDFSFSERSLETPTGACLRQLAAQDEKALPFAVKIGAGLAFYCSPQTFLHAVSLNDTSATPRVEATP